MKTSVKFLAILLAVLMAVSVFASCGENAGTPSKSNDTSSTGKSSNEQSFTVTFENSDISSIKAKSGETVSRPEDPKKSGYIFGGWYNDSVFYDETSFPILVTSDTTVYAKFLSYEEAFSAAREKTIGSNVQGFEYDYKLTASAVFSLISLTGTTEGKTQYSKSGDVSFYDAHKNSGVLFFDGSKYQILRGTSLQKISEDENGEITSATVEDVGTDYKYDSSSFAKALFEYSDDQLKSIEPTGTPNEYKLNTSFAISNALSILGNNINNPAVVKVIGELPETAVNTGMYVTFLNGKINTYRYEMNIDVSALTLSLIYELTFKESGSAIIITPKTFNIVSPADAVKNALAEVEPAITAFIAKEQSGYDFKIETGVDFGITENEINSKFSGSAFRKKVGNDIFFHNDIDIGGDFEDKNLYKADGMENLHYIKTKLEDGKVYLIRKKLLGSTDTEITDYTQKLTDSYFAFDVLNQTKDFSNATTETDTKKGYTVYTFDITSAGVLSILKYLNTELNLDPFDKVSKDIKVFGEFDQSTFNPSKAKLSVTLNGSEFIKAGIEIKGKIKTSFPGSVDFTQVKEATVELDCELTVNSDGNSFAPYKTVKDAK